MVNTLTIQQDGVRIFLHAANELAQSANCLERMRDRRKDKDSSEAKALWHGYFVLTQKLNEDIEHLRHRGGLLHFGCAMVDRTIAGEYVVLGAINHQE